jgi:hypothetical protein
VQQVVGIGNAADPSAPPFGIGIASHALVEHDLQSGRLVAPFGFAPSGRSYCVLHARQAANNAKIAAFRYCWLIVMSTPANNWYRRNSGLGDAVGLTLCDRHLHGGFLVRSATSLGSNIDSTVIFLAAGAVSLIVWLVIIA